MVAPATLDTWRGAVARLREGPAPRGEAFDLARRMLVYGPPGPDAAEAVRILLEGAMADALTDQAIAQTVMLILKAAGRGELHLAELLPP